MALPILSKPPQQTQVQTHHHHPSIPPSSSYPIRTNYRTIFAAVLLQIPDAAEAHRLLRVRNALMPRSVFILDWDDTCCATSYLERCGFMADLDTTIDQYAPHLASHLRLLESRVLSLLKTAVSLGTVLIVTNAGEGWVELSSSRFLPAVRDFLLTNERLIKIISARSRYVDQYRQHPLQWKALTFSEELRTIFAALPPRHHEFHVLVLGDSVGDQYAAHIAARSLLSEGMPIVLKVVKFLERPTIDQLCKELTVLLDHIQAMATHSGAFDVSMYKEPARVNTQNYPPQLHQQQQPQQQPQQPQQQLQQPQPQPQPQHVHHLAHFQQPHGQSSLATSEHMQSSQTTTASASSSDAQRSALSPVSAMATCAAAV